MAQRTDWTTASLDPIRLAAVVADLPAVCRSFGWDNPTHALEYLDPNESPELALVVDILTICRIGEAGQAEAWARLDAWAERTGALDRIVAAMV